MDATVTSLTNLANELIERVKELEGANAMLKQAACEQQALREADVHPSICADQIDNTVRALVKIGALREEEKRAMKLCLIQQPDAIYKVVQHLACAPRQVKQASFDNAVDPISGGRVVGVEEDQASAQDACLDRMSHLLNLY